MTEYQLQLQFKDNNGKSIKMYPINTSKDVLIPSYQDSGELELPGSKERTLEQTLKNITKYLDNLSVIAEKKRNISTNISDQSKDDVASTHSVYLVKEKVAEVVNAIGNILSGENNTRVHAANRLVMEELADNKGTAVQNIPFNAGVEDSLGWFGNCKSLTAYFTKKNDNGTKGESILAIGDASTRRGVLRIYGDNGPAIDLKPESNFTGTTIPIYLPKKVVLLY